ncbi:protein of unknown function (plasmid) [Azospirillum baldaniorum]|uniref:Uncharacterized protein n=1 Tax=Azospirillum baldaniorum TaxID=1064539 RepID=A0A9P1JXT8_9PROT|nr:protein of unknown function [Azospirillum baldaniorum]
MTEAHPVNARVQDVRALKRF